MQQARLENYGPALSLHIFCLFLGRIDRVISFLGENNYIIYFKMFVRAQILKYNELLQAMIVIILICLIFKIELSPPRD